LEILKVNEKATPDKPQNKSQKNNPPAPNNSLNKVDNGLIKLLSDSITDLADENGWAFLGELGNFILKKQPDFDPRNYGFTKMLTLIKSIHKFDVDERESGKNNIKHVYVKVR
jgi:Fe-S-cluster formation regulator IscX/YfhJ